MPEHWKYIGDGDQHYTGVPMRDLSEEEVGAMPEELQEKVVLGGIYRHLEIGPLRPQEEILAETEAGRPETGFEAQAHNDTDTQDAEPETPARRSRG